MPKHTCNNIITISAYLGAMPILFNKCYSAFRKQKKLNKLLRKFTCMIIFVVIGEINYITKSTCPLVFVNSNYLTIIPRARMGSESIACKAEGRMGYWLRGHEGERNNCFSKIQLVGKKYRDKTTLASKVRFSRHCFGFQSRRFSLLQNAALIII